MIKKIQLGLFYLLVLLLPLNLGKHFILSDSFVKTYPVDYLMPTIWVTDLFLTLILILWVLDGGVKNLFNKELKIVFWPILVFLLSLLPSVAVSARILSASFAFAGAVIHAGLALFVATRVYTEKHFRKVVSVLAVTTVLLSIMAFFQWQKQGSVFNNYLFFGEQPYSATTENIALTNTLGTLQVPVYGTFRHPNIFGGFLAVVLFWIYSQIILGQLSKKEKALHQISFILGLGALFLTFSQVAGAALILAVLFLHLIKKFGKRGVIFSLILTGLIFLAGLYLPVLPREGLFQDYPSVYRRSNLERSAYGMIRENFLFGVGLNNFTVRVEDYLPPSQVLRFIQPVHNIFVLILSEAGVFAFITFLALLVFVLLILLKQPFGIPAVLFVTILQFFIMGSFDHYLLTIQQTQLLFWLTVGLALTYTKKDVEV